MIKIHPWELIFSSFYLGKNPITGESIGSNGKCEDRTAKLTACCVDPSVGSGECPEPKGK